MSPPPFSTASERSNLLLDFPVRLYTALRTIRLYPASNPQVQRGNELVLQAFRALLESEADDSVNLAFSDGKIIVCGEHLADKDQTRPQIQGLITLLARLKIHSFTFHPTFSFEECAAFIQTLSALLGEKEMEASISSLLDKAGITSVSVDSKRYVAIREGEQIVRGDLIGSGLTISDEELASFVLGKTEKDPLQGVSAELVQELIDRLPKTGGAQRHPEDVSKSVIEFLHNLSKETDFQKHRDEIKKSAQALSGLDPTLLAKLVATLPTTPDADAILGSTLHQLSPQQLNTLISNLVAQQTLAMIPGRSQDQMNTDSLLNRLVNLEKDRKPAIEKAIAQNIDARQLLINPETTLSQLPDNLLQRLKQPEWSVPVLATAAQQVANPQTQAGGQVDFAAFNRMLGHYEQLLSREQQTQVARQAGAQMASMEGLALGNIIAQKFKGLFGEQLYSQVIGQVSDELLDETVEHLTPKQLNRMIATLTSDIPLQIGKDKDPDFKPADDSVLRRLAQTRKGPEITKAIAQNIDARQLLLNPETTLSQLPDNLLQRLKQPEWSVPVLATAAQQVANPQTQAGGQVDFAAFNRMLGHYEQLLSREQQTQVARQAGAQMASMEGLALGNIIAQKFKGLFGEQLYSQVIGQVSDELLDETVEHLTPKQLNRMIATLTSDIPLQIGKDKDPDFKPADDSVLRRLAQTRKGPEITKAIAQNIDARQLLLNPETTLSQLPDNLLQRLKQPEWSVPVLATAAQQVADPQTQAGGQVDFAAFNRMLGHYEQLLSREQQTQVARQAGAQMASMEGLALGNIIAQKFKGLFGEQLYSQVIGQVSDELLDETVEHLTPKQLNRMIATLTSDIPLQIGKDKDPDFKPADDSVLRRLAQTRKGPEITKAIAQNIDARQLLLNPETTLSQLPDNLLQRLKQPEWSVPVLATAAQQVANPQTQAGGQVDFAAFNRMLGHYEQLLSREQQTQVARQAGAQMASMEGLALGNIIAQKFKGLFGEQLYSQVIGQVSDELLDETVEHLTPKQLNRMIATLTSDIPLQIGKDKDPDFKPADDSVLRRLAQTRKGPEITKAIAQNIDARQLLLNPETTLSQLPDNLLQRLKQPEWSVPVLVAAARQSTDLAQLAGGGINHSSFENMLNRYDSLLNNEKQIQVATQVASQLSTFDEKELGLLLVRKYKSLFGEQLYRQVISQLSEDKLEKLVNHFRALAEGRDAPTLKDIGDKDIEEAYQRLQQTVRAEKMRAIVEMHQQQKKLQEEQRQGTMQSSLENLLRGDLKDLEKSEIQQALPETVRNLLFENQEGTADDLLMRLAVASQHDNPSIRNAAFQTLAAIAEQFAQIGQWERLEKLLPALKQGVQLQGINDLAVQQTMTAIGGLSGYYLTEEKYSLAAETAHVLRTFSTQDTASGAVNPLIRQHALETLKSLCSEPALEQLMDLYLHSEMHQEAAGKMLIEMGLESAKFQLRHLMNNESRFERKRLLSLIKQTGNPSLSILLQQLHKDSPWFVVRNIIRLLGEIGNPALFTAIKPFINHPDLRVQQEVINTSTKIGGENLKDFLLHALQTVDDSVKIRVVNHIAANNDERFVRPLTDLLEGTKPFLGKNKNDLQLAICKTLSAIGSKRATTSLNRVAQSKNILGLGGYSEEVRQAAGVALEQIQEASASKRDEDEEFDPVVSGGQTAQPATGPSAAPAGSKEDAIFRLAAEGNRDQAKQQLVDLIAATARAGDFQNAERLRERIYEIDSYGFGRDYPLG